MPYLWWFVSLCGGLGLNSLFFCILKLLRWNDCVNIGKSVFDFLTGVLCSSSPVTPVKAAELVQSTVFLLGSGSFTFGRQNEKKAPVEQLWLFLLPRTSSSLSPNETTTCSSTAALPAKPPSRLIFSVFFYLFFHSFPIHPLNHGDAKPRS